MACGFVLTGLCVLAAMHNFGQTWTGYRVRLAIAKFATGYDGCACDDCGPQFLGISGPRRYGCFPPALRVEDRATIWACAAFGTAAVTLAIPLAPSVARRHDPDRCAWCGYDLRGLPGPICPECGQRAEQAAGIEDERT